jgi:hypothetical protein
MDERREIAVFLLAVLVVALCLLAMTLTAGAAIYGAP